MNRRAALTGRVVETDRQFMISLPGAALSGLSVILLLVGNVYEWPKIILAVAGLFMGAGLACFVVSAIAFRRGSRLHEELRAAVREANSRSRQPDPALRPALAVCQLSGMVYRRTTDGTWALLDAIDDDQNRVVLAAEDWIEYHPADTCWEDL